MKANYAQVYPLCTSRPAENGPKIDFDFTAADAKLGQIVLRKNYRFSPG
jgi:hypothetical protein